MKDIFDKFILQVISYWVDKVIRFPNKMHCVKKGNGTIDLNGNGYTNGNCKNGAGVYKEEDL